MSKLRILSICTMFNISKVLTILLSLMVFPHFDGLRDNIGYCDLELKKHCFLIIIARVCEFQVVLICLL